MICPRFSCKTSGQGDEVHYDQSLEEVGAEVDADADADAELDDADVEEEDATERIDDGLMLTSFFVAAAAAEISLATLRIELEAAVLIDERPGMEKEDEDDEEEDGGGC